MTESLFSRTEEGLKKATEELHNNVSAISVGLATTPLTKAVASYLQNGTDDNAKEVITSLNKTLKCMRNMDMDVQVATAPTIFQAIEDIIDSKHDNCHELVMQICAISMARRNDKPVFVNNSMNVLSDLYQDAFSQALKQSHNDPEKQLEIKKALYRQIINPIEIPVYLDDVKTTLKTILEKSSKEDLIALFEICKERDVSPINAKRIDLALATASSLVTYIANETNKKSLGDFNEKSSKISDNANLLGDVENLCSKIAREVDSYKTQLGNDTLTHHPDHLNGLISAAETLSKQAKIARYDICEIDEIKDMVAPDELEEVIATLGS